jgi:filamin
MNFNEEINAAVKTSSLIHINDANKIYIEEHQQIPMKGYDDKWIIIQKNTFTNWINEQLKRDTAVNITEIVHDLQNDLCDGVKLVKLITILQQPNPKIPKRFFKKPINQHQSLENATLALNAITEDGIKLVNIGRV